MKKHRTEIINLTKNILIEGIDFKNNEKYNPEMYYLVSLYIMETLFDFYSEDIFKFLLYNGFHYFKEQNLSNEDKSYLLIFEKELKNWNGDLIYEEIERIFLDLLTNEKKRIIEKIKKEKLKSNRIDEQINIMAVRIKEKYTSNVRLNSDNLLDELFDLLD
ncbi:MAG: hypothetical protein AB7T10_04170 [bacterium]